jgi:protein tyrosine/serine phosphatase
MITEFDIIQIEDYGKLYISIDREDWAMVIEHGISVLIDLDGDIDRGVPSMADQIIYIYFPILDEDLPNLDRLHAVASMAAGLCRKKYAVLAHCMLGLNRSGLMLGLILTYLGLTGEAALTLLRARRPGALFNETFAEYLRSLPAHNGVASN